ncbi:TfpX/TfpZ family type IV pilin accessory protein [Pseudomonas aeruginosa]|uniref:TfpX/TfpZ family type IV pilin accessory protein n=1 Tax=Pseudomonas aeruginosa TaxID=287 RepID=UPI0003B97B5B|nr:TfpX/TfpZ family type IV pilin accessory protein [Pseudomonas aeruginosa]EKX5124246.1 type IV pilin accessory protein [Pseudomonas aeruginosa]EMC2589747.1 type IV pilin accessory protein [Pseudomonas aeruginosa]ERV40557.1 hypothetical protein Q064_04889 [Pseudomonas aeruginosa BL10]KAB0697279.1 type IV pilin accessory protein [Pseudomonas aeruginosa]MBI8434774.1 type IV pilin accessory protein [Pseudomonas aeruginosa]
MNEKIRAFAVHFLISALVCSLFSCFAFWVWYPGPLSARLGLWHILLLLVMVDVGLGPLMTFIVYRKGKNSLFFDLSVICLLQFVAFAYGVWTIAEGRPAWLVFNVDRFDLVRVSDLDRVSVNVREQYRRAPLWGAGMVAVALPLLAKERSELLMDVLRTGRDIPFRPELYVPLAQQKQAIRSKLRPLSELSVLNTRWQLVGTLTKYPEADCWLPLRVENDSLVVLMTRETAQIVAIVDLRAWKQG